MTDMAKIFWSGRSQAVRLPKEYRLEGKEVHISRDGRKLILEPIEEDGWAWLDQLEPLDSDATAALSHPGADEVENLLGGLTQLHPGDTTGSRRRDSYQHRLPGRRKRRRLGPVKNCEFARVHFSQVGHAAASF